MSKKYFLILYKDVDNTETINVLSLCTGYGGLELGLAGALEGVFRVVAVEVEAYALANLAAKAQEGKLAVETMWPDVKTFHAERFRGCFDFVLAGYPCQPFSVAGNRKGTDDPRHLWPHIARIVQAVRPVWCFFENVPGHLILGFPEVYRSLRDMGYKVKAGLFTAAECGAPHKRERLFILANDTMSRSRGLSIRWLRQEQASIDINGSSKAMAKSQSIRQLWSKQTSNIQTRCTVKGASFENWPARPGRPQYEWEESRVVGNAKKQDKNKRRKRKLRAWQEANEKRQTNLDNTDRPSGKHQGQAQSGVGRAVDGTQSRVDRLRLLGNGVVPQQAEKAFRELIKLFE